MTAITRPEVSNVMVHVEYDVSMQPLLRSDPDHVQSVDDVSVRPLVPMTDSIFDLESPGAMVLLKVFRPPLSGRGVVQSEEKICVDNDVMENVISVFKSINGLVAMMQNLLLLSVILIE